MLVTKSVEFSKEIFHVLGMYYFEINYKNIGVLSDLDRKNFFMATSDKIIIL